MTTLPHQVSQTKEAARLLRFLAVGGIGTLLDFTLLTALKLVGLPTLPANSLSFSAGVVNNFILNRRWTFADVARSPWGRQLLQFTLVSLVGLVMNNALVLLLENPLGILVNQPELGYVPAKIVATGVVVFWNYLANRTWTFR